MATMEPNPPNKLALAVVVLGSLLAQGCGRHLALSAPPKTAPLDERQEAYDRLRIKSLGTITYRKSTTFYWHHGDDRRVRHFSDLGDVVDDDSETAKHIHAYYRAGDDYSYLNWIALGTLVGGFTTGLIGISEESWVIGAVGGASLLSSPVFYFTARIKTQNKQFGYGDAISKSYNPDLRDHLGLQLTADFLARQRAMLNGDDPATHGFRDAGSVDAEVLPDADQHDDATGGFRDTSKDSE